MTDLLERAVALTRGLSPEMQDDIARMMLTVAGEEQSLAPLTAEDEPSFAKSVEQSARQEFATDEHVRAIWAKHGL